MEKKPEEVRLTAAAEGWLENLPDNVKPKVIQEQYPRIVNRLASMWKHPDEFVEYLDELLVDKRGDRDGFPMTIALELATIKDYYEITVHPERTKAYLWDPRQQDQRVKVKKKKPDQS